MFCYRKKNLQVGSGGRSGIFKVDINLFMRVTHLYLADVLREINRRLFFCVPRRLTLRRAYIAASLNRPFRQSGDNQSVRVYQLSIVLRVHNRI